MQIEKSQVNECDNLNYSKLQQEYIKNSSISTEINDLCRKNRILLQKLCRRNTKIIYLQKLLANLKKKIKHYIHTIRISLYTIRYEKFLCFIL